VLERGQGTRSDRFGRYTLRNLPPGTYTVRAQLLGRQTERRLTIPSGTVELDMYDLALGQ
jgi:hypothetical protein